MGVDDHDTFSGLTPLQQAAQQGDVAKVVELLDVEPEEEGGGGRQRAR